MASIGVLKILLLLYLPVCAKAQVRGMISGHFGRGRADVFYNGIWGSIGNNGWDDKDATVFCRSLGYSSGTAIPSAELYNRRGTIWLDNVDCKGDELSLDECYHFGWGKTVVDANKPASEIIAGVQCFGDVVRIAGSKTQGRAEIFRDGTWGSIAADNWDDNDAKVFCSMLGYRKGKATRLPAIPVVLEKLNCIGHETTIEHCAKQIASKGICSGTEDVAGVKCVGEKVRIVGGSKRGRAEIFYDGKWGTICDSPGNNDAATVFCRMLGYWTGRYPGYTQTKAYPMTPIWFQEFSCTGTESTLAQCGYGNLKNTTCKHDEDIEVSCSNVQARISTDAGRAELSFNGQWLPICANAMTEGVANVFCRTLGLRNGKRITTSRTSTEKLTLKHVDCSGNEDSIQQCKNIGWSSEGCHENSIAYITCSGDIAARGPHNEVIVYHGDASGSVCADKWDDIDANVYCRMMGFREGTASNVSASTSTSDFHLTDLHCLGHETSLFQCSHDHLASDICINNAIAAADCTGSLVRIKGLTENKGRAEVFHNGQWGTICSNYWDDKSAKVFCQMLGYKKGVVFDPYDMKIPENSGPVWLSDVTCTGNESHILQCGHTDWEDHHCIHEYDTGVDCS